MAQQVQFLSKLSLYLLILFTGCNSATMERSVYINGASKKFTHIKDSLFYNREPFTGSVYTLFSSGDTAEISGFVEGKEHGTRIKYYDNGKVREKRGFFHGRKTGLYQAWWENGKNMLLYHFENDEYEGLCREWNRQGKLIRNMHYKKGHEEGAQTMFYDNGKVRANYIVLNGRRYGLLGTKNCVNVADSVFNN